MNKRPLCTACQRPQKVCLCSMLTSVAHRTPVHVLMHPSEQHNAKGTAKILCRMLTQGQLWIGESESELAALQQALSQGPQPVWLLYPDPEASAIEALAKHALTPAVGQLLVLDGTWRKTLKLLQLHPWLQRLPKVAFAQPPRGHYQIRKAKRHDSLSTLEAVSYALEQLEQLDSSPLQQAFEALKQTQLAHMPIAVQARYQQ